MLTAHDWITLCQLLGFTISFVAALMLAWKKLCSIYPVAYDTSGGASWAQAANVVFYATWAINALVHLPSLTRPQLRGDELVYMALSREMGWDLSHYTTKDVDRKDMADPISNWPNSIYRQPLFHHGPAFPYLLKVGGLLGVPVAFAFVMMNIAIGTYFVSLRQLQKRLAVHHGWRIIAYVGAATCPLLAFTTTRLYHDGLTGLYIAIGLIGLIETLERNSVPWAIWSACWISLALNTRFSAILVIPVLPTFFIYSAWQDKREATADQRAFSSSVFLTLVFFGIVLTVGLAHFYRLLSTYGTINPKVILVPDTAHPWYEFLSTRNRSLIATYLLLSFPMLGGLLLPQTCMTILASLRQRSWGGMVTLVFMYFMLALMVMSYKEMRFFALALPLFYAAAPWLFSRLRGGSWLLGLIVVSYFIMGTAQFREVFVRPHMVSNFRPIVLDAWDAATVQSKRPRTVDN